MLDGFPDAANTSELGLNQAWLLRGRALPAQACGDDTAYRKYVESYRAEAEVCGYAGHLAMAQAM